MPPVYDFLSEESFFRIEETAISNISMEIQKMKSSEEYLQAKTDKIEAKQWYERKIEDGKRHLKQGKKERELKRRECTDKQLLDIYCVKPQILLVTCVTLPSPSVSVIRNTYLSDILSLLPFYY